MGAGFNVVARGGREADIYLYEDVGFSFFGGVTAKQFSDELKALGKVETINLRVNSNGGEVFEGFAIYNQLAQHSARIVVHIDGLAASIASVIAMAGDEIRIAESGFVMIHNANGGVMGGSEDMRKMADLLDTVSGSIADVYVERTGKSRDDILAMMAAETWMTGNEALSSGFADQMVTNLRVAARVDPEKHGFKRAPAVLLAMSAAAAPVADPAPGAPPRPKASAAAQLAARMAARAKTTQSSAA